MNEIDQFVKAVLLSIEDFHLIVVYVESHYV